MGLLTVHGITVSVDFGDNSFGNGNGRFMSVSAKVPSDSGGIPLTQPDEIISDGVEMYLTAWQTALQTRYATGEIDGPEYKRQTAAFLVRIDRIKALYQRIKGMSIEELTEFLKKDKESNVSQ